MTVQSALALHQQFMVHRDMLERVEVFRYLGCLLLQDDNYIQAMRSQLRKACRTCARVRQVLQSENLPPWVSAKFYKAIVQSVLLCGSEMWVLSPAVVARIKGFHIRTAYWVAKEYTPRWGLNLNRQTDKVLEECGMHMTQHYIDVQRETITKHVVGHSIFA